MCRIEDEENEEEHIYTYHGTISKNEQKIISRLQAVDMFYVISGKINNISYSALMKKVPFISNHSSSLLG